MNTIVDKLRIRNTIIKYIFDLPFIFLPILAIAVWKFPIITPGVYISPNKHIFSGVKKGTQIHKEFKIYNLHPYPIQILQVSGTCGCTRIFKNQAPPFVLKPFNSTEIKISISTEEEEGDFNKTVKVISSDKLTGSTIVLKGNVFK